VLSGLLPDVAASTLVARRDVAFPAAPVALVTARRFLPFVALLAFVGTFSLVLDASESSGCGRDVFPMTNDVGE